MSNHKRGDQAIETPSTQILRSILAVIAVTLAALVLGGLTSPAQQYLPEHVNSFANSASGWTLLTFVLVLLARVRPWIGALTGAAAFVAMVEGYRIVSEWRGFGYGEPFHDVFTVLGLIAGPTIGASASLLRYGSRPWRGLAIAPLAAVLLGEGVYGLTLIADTTSPVYWTIIFVLAVALTATNLWRVRPGLWISLATIGLTLAGATAFWLLYQSL